MAKWVIQSRKKGSDSWSTKSQLGLFSSALKIDKKVDELNREAIRDHWPFEYRAKLYYGNLTKNPAPKMASGARMQARSITLPKSTSTTIAEMRRKLKAKKNPGSKISSKYIIIAEHRYYPTKKYYYDGERLVFDKYLAKEFSRKIAFATARVLLPRLPSSIANLQVVKA